MAKKKDLPEDRRSLRGQRAPSSAPSSASSSAPSSGPPSGQETTPVAGWREVTLEQYRLWTTLSSILGVLLLAWGIWRVSHMQLVTGLLLVVAGFVAGLWTVLLQIQGTPGELYEPVSRKNDQWTPRVLHFYTRRECTLCDEARTRLEPELAKKGITLVPHDVDEDPVLRERYGSRVPVALYKGQEVFALQYDEGAVKTLR